MIGLRETCFKGNLTSSYRIRAASEASSRACFSALPKHPARTVASSRIPSQGPAWTGWRAPRLL